MLIPVVEGSHQVRSACVTGNIILHIVFMKFIVRQRSCGKVVFSVLSMCLSFCPHEEGSNVGSQLGPLALVLQLLVTPGGAHWRPV